MLDLLAAGTEPLRGGLASTPVAAPPYLVVTGRGPVCRGTLDSGARLVVEVVLFGVERRPPRYRYRDPSPEECLVVSLR